MQKAGYTPFRWRRKNPVVNMWISTWPMDVWVITRLTTSNTWTVARRRHSGGYSIVVMTPTLKKAQEFAENYVPGEV